MREISKRDWRVGLYAVAALGALAVLGAVAFVVLVLFIGMNDGYAWGILALVVGYALFSFSRFKRPSNLPLSRHASLSESSRALLVEILNGLMQSRMPAEQVWKRWEELPGDQAEELTGLREVVEQYIEIRDRHREEGWERYPGWPVKNGRLEWLRFLLQTEVEYLRQNYPVSQRTA